MKLDIDDVLAITNTLYEYALALDSRDWVMYESCFTPDATIEIPARGISFSRDELLEYVRPRFEALGGTHHVIANPIVRSVNDAVTSRCELFAVHWGTSEAPPDGQYVVHGRYVDVLKRIDDHWGIETRTVHTLHVEGSYESLVPAQVV